MTVIGWVDAFLSPYSTASFTEARRQALIACVRHRHYNFNYSDHITLPYSAPLYDDNTLCVLTKAQFDSVFDEVYADIPCGLRLLPMDAIKRHPKNDILYESEKYENNRKGT